MANKITASDAATPGSPALVPMLLICCSLTNTGIFTFDPGDDPSASLGNGIGVDAVAACLRGGQGRVRASACVPTWSPAPSVTHAVNTGSGPTITCALATGASGCFDDHSIYMLVSTGGTGGGGAAVDIAYDGSTTTVETRQIPAEAPAVLRGVVDIRFGMDLSGLTLVYTGPAAKTLTFPSGPFAASAADGLHAATATVAAPVTLTTADLVPAAIALLDAANGSRLVFTTAGVTPSDAPANVVITGIAPDGTTAGETLNIAQTATTASTVNRYKAAGLTLVYPAAQGTAATVAIGYTDTYPTAKSIVDEYNTLAAASPLAVRARQAQSAAGPLYLETYSTAAGSGVAQTIDAATSTGDGTLGFTSAAANLTATGAAAVLTLPKTGLSFTFPTSTAYVKGDVYTAVATGPRATIGALVTAANLARAQYKTAPFGLLAVAQPAPDAPTMAATVAALNTLTAAWYADSKRPTPCSAVTGWPFHAASSVANTNDANIVINDAAVIAAFNNQAANLDATAGEDVYLPGSTSLVLGDFRRTAVLSYVVKTMLASKLAGDPSEDVIPEASLEGPDGHTLARDENTATTKMGEGTGHYMLQSTSTGLGAVKFSVGQTRAGSGSLFRHAGPSVRIALEIIRLVFPFVEFWPGQTNAADPVTGQMADKVKDIRRKAVIGLLAPTLTPRNAPANVTQFDVQILDPPAGRWFDNGITPVVVKFFPLGIDVEVTITVTATGQAITKQAA